MYRFFRFSVISVVVALAPLLAHAGDAHWRVVETSGQVELSSASGFMPASVSNDVNPGSVLRTGANGRAVIENNGDRITVAPNSVFELPTQNAGAMEQVKQSVGTALYDMVPRGVDRFRVETPYLAALIKGTVFTVAVTPKGAAVEVLRGVVQVTDGDGHAPTLVYPGQTATVMASAKGEVHLLGKPPASAPKGNAPATPQQNAPQSAAADGAGEATAHADEHAGGLHIEHTIAPHAVAIDTLTNGLITHVDAANAAASGHGKRDAAGVQTASLSDGFSGGSGKGNGSDDFAATGIAESGGDHGGGNAFAGFGNNGIGNSQIGGFAANGLGGGNGNGNGNGGGNGLGAGLSASLGVGLASNVSGNGGGVGLGLGNGGGNGNGGGLGLGLGNGGGNANNGIPPGLLNSNPGNGNGNAGGNGNGNAGGNGNGNGNAGGNGNGNGHHH